MRLLDRYIRNAVISATLVVLLALVGVQSFMELVSQLQDIGTGNYTIWSALLTVPLRIPSDLYIFFPVAGFLGCLLGMGRLASTSQLIIMRASGVSIAQISWSIIKASLILIIFFTLVGEFLAPKMQNKADKIEQVALGQVDNPNLQDIWIRQNNRFMHIDAITSPQTVKGIVIFDFNGAGKLLSSSMADNAQLINHRWQLENVKKTLFLKDKTRALQFDTLPLSMSLDPQVFFSSSEHIQSNSISSLIKNIAYRERNGLIVTQYQLSLWQRILQPFTTVIMILLGIPFIFGSLRSSTMGHRMLIGIIIGFAFYMLNRLFGPITIVYQFPPILAALTPAMLFLVAYAILVRRIN